MPAAGTDEAAMRGVFADAFGTQFRDHLSTQRLADRLRNYKVQNCFMQVCVLGEGYYDSKLLPRPAGMPIGYTDPLKDLLTIMNTGSPTVRVHAWISALQVQNKRAIVPPPKGHVAVEHPEWLNKDVEGNTADSSGWVYLDPAVPAVQDYVVSIVREIASNYAVDGILLDELRYPEQGSRFGYNEIALKRYQQEMGVKGRPDPLDAKWLQWRREQITALLARVTREIKQINPKMIVSVTASASGPAPRTDEGFKFSQPYMAALEDWVNWASLEIPDWIVLQNFSDEQLGANQFDEWTRFAVANKKNTRMWIGVAGYQNWAIDAFHQVQRAARDGADGVAIYNFRQPVRDIATADDLFSAIHALTAGSDASTTMVANTTNWEERLRRMSSAMETPPSPPSAPAEIAPGVANATPLMPASLPLASAPVRSSRLPFMTPWDQVYLTNRTTFEGHKISELNGESIFETSSGLIIKINNQYIDRIRPGQ